MALIRLTDMDGKAVYIKAEEIALVRRDLCTQHPVLRSSMWCTIVFLGMESEPIEVRTKPGRIARLVREATSWVELP